MKVVTISLFSLLLITQITFAEARTLFCPSNYPNGSVPMDSTLPCRLPGFGGNAIWNATDLQIPGAIGETVHFFLTFTAEKINTKSIPIYWQYYVGCSSSSVKDVKQVIGPFQLAPGESHTLEISTDCTWALVQNKYPGADNWGIINVGGEMPAKDNREGYVISSSFSH